MEDPDTQLEYDYTPYLRLYKSGRLHRFVEDLSVPAGLNSSTGVTSKDVHITSNITARLFLPNTKKKQSFIPGCSSLGIFQNNKKPIDNKLPVLIYFHGGGFVVGSPFAFTYDNYVSSLASKANVISISVNYRLAPEHVLPAAFEDALTAIQWVTSGSHDWLIEYGDLDRVFLAGDSAGANIAHNVIALNSEMDLKVKGIVLIHPYFWGSSPVGKELYRSSFLRSRIDKSWGFISGWKMGVDDAIVDPTRDVERLKGLKCERVMVVVAENDVYRERGFVYYEALKGSEWGREVEFFETEEEQHVFHLQDPLSERASDMMKCVAEFINRA